MACRMTFELRGRRRRSRDVTRAMGAVGVMVAMGVRCGHGGGRTRRLLPRLQLGLGRAVARQRYTLWRGKLSRAEPTRIAYVLTQAMLSHACRLSCTVEARAVGGLRVEVIDS